MHTQISSSNVKGDERLELTLTPANNLEREFFNAMTEYASLQSSKDKERIAVLEGEFSDLSKVLDGVEGELIEAKERIAELEAKVNGLTMDNMTHEYNQSEAKRFAHEFNKMIAEEHFIAGCEYVLDMIESGEMKKTFDSKNAFEEYYKKTIIYRNGKVD